MNNMNESSNSGFIVGMLVGAVAGAGLALLFAPKKGSQLRGEIGESMTTFKDAASKRLREVADRAGTGINAGLSDLNSAVGKAAGAATTTAREMLDSAVEHGRQEIRSRV
jgi:gas vesicle protein